MNPKVAIITGASKGIGKAIAFRLAQEGYALMLSARQEKGLKICWQELQEAFPEVQVEIFVGSIAEPNLVSALMKATLERFGRLDCVINNAGIAAPFQLFQELSDQMLNDIIDINLKGPMFLMKAAIPVFVRQGQGGFIININSEAGKTAFPYSAAYCASKFGLRALTESVAEEQRLNQIKVIGIYPGQVHTPIWDEIEPGVPQDPHKMLRPEDIAEGVWYALSQPEATFVKDLNLSPLYFVLK